MSCQCINISFSFFLKNLRADLLESAELLFLFAEEESYTSYDRLSHSWYHKAWQFLRIMDLVSSPTWHIDFYLSFFDENITDSSKILISGTADYSLLALILESAREKKVSPKIYVLDVAMPPLKVSKWYSERYDYPVSIFHQNILEFTTTERFDIICTDAFLTRFKPLERTNVLRKWNSLLSKNGRIITTTRIENEDVKNYVPISIGEISEFGRKVDRSLSQEYISSKVNIKQLAIDYISNIKSYAYPSKNQLFNDINSSGLEIEDLDDVYLKGEVKETLYVRLIMKISFM